ncbi:hypothetical protein HZY83_04310 [Gemella sp. GH3]|nr:hypothetical protein [Gemella sp. GH3.1]NYS50855.1 hypothetical protein [Gemella sp. GH3]
MPFISKDRDLKEWLEEVELSKSKLVPKRNMQRTKEGLVAGDVILMWRVNFGTFTTESIKPGMYPKYFEYSYGIDAPNNLEILIKEGYIKIDSIKDSLQHTTITNLKKFLKDNKVVGISKMKKEDVYTYIKDNFSEDELSKYIKVLGYSLTEKGKNTLSNNSDIIDKHPKKKF